MTFWEQLIGWSIIVGYGLFLVWLGRKSEKALLIYLVIQFAVGFWINVAKENREQQTQEVQP